MRAVRRGNADLGGDTEGGKEWIGEVVNVLLKLSTLPRLAKFN